MPADQFHYTFPGELIRFAVKQIESLIQLVDLVTPPLRPLPVGTVVIGVPHTDVKCSLSLLPIRVENGVGTRERSRELSVITSLTELDTQDFNLRRKNIIKHFAVHPSETLIFLDTFFGDILGADALGIGDHIVIGVHRDHHPLRRLDFEPRREMAIIRQLAIERVSALPG